MAEHGIAPLPYLRDVHDIDFTVLTPDPELAGLISALPGRKIVHTNGDSAYATRVLEHRGLMVFDAIHGVEEVGFYPKPDPRAYAAVLAAEASSRPAPPCSRTTPATLPSRIGLECGRFSSEPAVMARTIWPKARTTARMSTIAPRIWANSCAGLPQAAVRVRSDVPPTGNR